MATSQDQQLSDDMNQAAVTLAQLATWLAIAVGTFIILDGLTIVAHPVTPHLGLAAFGAALITTALAAAPFLRFLARGWQVRREEFLNRLSNKALFAYLLQFWEQTLVESFNRRVCMRLYDTADHEAALGLFNKIYDGQYGKTAFITPLILVLAVVAIETVLIIFTALGHVPSVPDEFALPCFGAVTGTYMFVVGDSVMSVRRRSLNISDVYWYALRLVLAVPIGVAVGKLGGSVMAAFVLGTLPIDQFRKMLARYAGANFTDLEAATQAPDQLLQLEGVTGDIAAQLTLEGIYSIEQLVGADPVSLAIRTGLPFKFLLRLGSQAVVRRHLGEGAKALVPLGLADAEPVAALSYNLKSADAPTQATAKTILDQAVANIQAVMKSNVPGRDALAAAFDLIAKESYTKFLLANVDFGLDEPCTVAGCKPEKRACGVADAAAPQLVALPDPVVDPVADPVAGPVPKAA